MSTCIEICAASAGLCIEAFKRGAARAELCAFLEAGGITPSYGEIAAVKNAAPEFPVHVLIRPRPGNFVYTQLEIAAMFHDIEICRQLGVNGVVLGPLTKEGAVDTILLKKLAAAAKPLSITFHRAFDQTIDYFSALEEIIAAGCERLLCSGGKAGAEEGVSMLAELVKRAKERIIIMPGGGVRAQNLQHIVQTTGVKELHSSSLDVLDNKSH